ncbi:hypothetical protein BJ165DRAFT_1000296 [Panaeolus papilionaceus]|nr:hypothetical protein BJ165DRAFT_1000296 [Panaeolus papilionaceus]
MSFGLVSEASTRSSSIDMSFSESDIGFTQLDMDLNVDNVASQLNQHNIASSNTEQENQNQMTTPMERDPIYFCENVVLAAEDRLFCVPKGGLANHGTYFQSLFSRHGSHDQLPLAGSSEQHPIVLEGVSKNHLHNFLRVIYPFYGVDVPFGDEHWIGILDLATKWGFQEVRETAITHLEHLFTSGSSRRDPIVALFLCQKYGVQKYMKQQFEAIITSIKAPDSSTMLAGGISTDTVLVLKDLRDRWMSGMLWGEKGSGSSDIFPRRWSARKIVEDHFAALDPRPMTQDEKDLDACWVQDEAKWLEDEVRCMKEAEKDEVAVGGNEEIGETGDRPDECVQPGEELVDDEATGASATDEDVPDDIGAQNEKLILLHRDKHEIAELVQELKEKGVNDADSEMQSLKSVVEEYDRKLREYWGKVTGLPASQTQKDAAGGRKTKQVVDLGGYDAQDSRQKLEQVIQDQLHPGAKSLAFSIRLGSGSINAQIRNSVMNSILSRYSLSADSCSYNGRIQYEIGLSSTDFGNWLERFRSNRIL